MALRRIIPRFSLRTLVVFLLLVTAGVGLWWRWSPYRCELTIPFRLVSLPGHLWAGFSPNGKEVAATTQLDGVVFCDATTGKPLRKAWRPQEGYVGAFAYTADGPLALLYHGDVSSMVTPAWVVNTRNGERVADVGGVSPMLPPGGFSWSGDRAITVVWRDAFIWDISQRARYTELKGHAAQVTAVAYSRDGTKALTGSKDKTGRVWDAETGECLKVLRGHSAELNSAAFSSDGTRVATGGADGTVRIFNPETGHCELLLTGQGAGIFSIRFSPDGRRLVTASRDETARVWDSQTGSELGPPLKHDGYVFSAEFSPDGRAIVTHSSVGDVRVWRRRRPEWWWGVFWLWEFWLTVAFAGVFVWSVVRDRKLLKVSAQQ